MQLAASKHKWFNHISGEPTRSHSLLIYTKGPEMSQREEGTRDSLLYSVVALREQSNIHNAVFCEVSFEDNVDRFQSGSVHELYCLNPCQISKVHGGSPETTN